MKNRFAKANWKATDILVIDEVSMMSLKLFELLDTIGKTVRRNSQPFGGIQIIFSGDFYQLPPVGNKDEPDTTKFCFESPSWFEIFKLEDHINLQGDNPLRGRNYDVFGPRFPDMSAPYDAEMITKAKAIADKNNIRTHIGTYVSVMGPNLETRAEYKFLRIIGGDVVGMSTVPEVIVANHMSMPVFAISVITDEGFPETLEPVSIPEIVAVAQAAEPKLTFILKELIANL